MKDVAMWYAVIFAAVFACLTGIAIFRLEDIRSQRNDLVLQICDYSRVANTDTVTELCTKFQQQTGKEYLCNTKNECKVD